MMDYGVFKELLKDKLPEYLPEGLKGTGVELGHSDKVNVSFDTIVVHPAAGCKVSPSFNLEKMYQNYQDGAGIEEILHKMADTVRDTYERSQDMADVTDFGKLKDNVVMALVNTEQNREFLKDKPHREFQDLSVIYRWIVGTKEDGIASVVINDGMVKDLGMSADELFQAAVQNTKAMFPPKVTDMAEMMMSLMMPEGADPEMVAAFGGLMTDIPAKEKMWVITNEKGINGACSMLYEDILHDLAKEVGTDLYILPSSIHEVIAVSVETADPETLTGMVQDVNMAEVNLEDRLSNNLYHYDKDLRTIRMATDVPNKRLDGIVAEQPKLEGRQQGIPMK